MPQHWECRKLENWIQTPETQEMILICSIQKQPNYWLLFFVRQKFAVLLHMQYYIYIRKRKTIPLVHKTDSPPQFLSLFPKCRCRSDSGTFLHISKTYLILGRFGIYGDNDRYDACRQKRGNIFCIVLHLHCRR